MRVIYILLVLLIMTSAFNSVKGATSLQPAFVNVDEGRINVPPSFSLINLVFFNNNIYVLAEDNNATYLLVYRNNTFAKREVYEGRVLSGSLSVDREKKVLVLALLLENYTITVYRVNTNGSLISLSREYNIKLDPLSYLPRDIAITPGGYIAVGGSLYTEKYSLQNLIILFNKNKMVWNKSWGGPGKDIVWTVSAGPDSICTASIPNAFRCFNYQGDVLVSKSLGDRIVFLKNVNDYVIANFIYNNKSFIIINNYNYNTVPKSVDITPYVITDASIDPTTGVLILSGPLKIGNKYSPGFILLNISNYKIISKIMLKKECSTPPQVLNIIKLKYINIIYTCNQTLYIDKIEQVNHTETPTQSTTTGTRTSSSFGSNRLIIIHYTLLTISIILIISAIYINKKKLINK